MLVSSSDRDEMESFLDVNGAEVLGALDVIAEVVDIRQLSGILQCLVIQGAKVATGPHGAIMLNLEVKRGAVVEGVMGVYFFYYS